MTAMTTTELERVEFTVEDPGIHCDSEDCPNTATLAIHLYCSCIALSCRSCYEELIFFIVANPGIPMECLRHHVSIPVHRVSDFIKSVTPL